METRKVRANVPNSTLVVVVRQIGVVAGDRSLAE